MKTPHFDLEIHNAVQRDYFERSQKRGMRPVFSRYLNRQVEEVLKHCPVEPGQRLLEVGCGMGRYTLLLAERGLAVEGLDLSPVLLKRLKSYNRGKFKIPLHCADIQNRLPDLENSFDVVMGFFMLHHVKDLNACFSSLKRLLKPKGRMIFLEPNPYNPLYYLQILLTPEMTWEGDKGIIQMRRTVLQKAMKKAGLKNFNLSRFGFFPPFLANASWGSVCEKALERFPPWKNLLPFQLIQGER
ncbi:MAG: methyltransferase domain-containing protein [bacterium]